jgi:hypothetical protein
VQVPRCIREEGDRKRMNRFLATAFAGLLLSGGSAIAASVTVSTLVDTEDGLSYGVSGLISPTDQWSVGAGVEQSETNAGGADFSGTALRLSTDVMLGPFNAGASVRRWKDSNQVKSTSIQAQFGWLAENGLSISALLDDRNMTVEYVATILGATRTAHIDFKGTGFGADISWFGTQWNLGARYLEYSYGISVTRVRAAMTSVNTDRFPRVESLLDSIVTRAVGAPDRQYMATVGRSFARSSLQGDWVLQRDALTHDEVKSLSATWGYKVNAWLWLDATAGFSDTAGGDSMTFGGLALTLRPGHRQ